MKGWAKRLYLLATIAALTAFPAQGNISKILQYMVDPGGGAG
ncbi:MULTISPECIES: hypothetical protein [unclassified Bacillus (in: firmicutes)]|nr:MULTISPECIES: hypothetical protein [unclassified Bacillus (in: firmicutes)]